MATELKYNGEWLIPLQSGYRIEYPQGLAVRPAAVVVSASFRLRDTAMIAWWQSLYQSGVGGRWSVALDTTGWLSVHNCAIIEPPAFGDYRGHTAALSLRMAAYTAGPEAITPATFIGIDEYDFSLV